MTKGGLTRHLSTCSQRQGAIHAANQEPGQEQALYHLQVRDAYRPDYWLHLEINGSATLTGLDRYLRAIWLECCGHLSRFSFGGWGGGETPKRTRAERVLAPGVELTHIYDFGTSSETLVKAVAARQGKPLTRHPIFLMGRNDPPPAYCTECKQPAAWLCMECLVELDEPGTLCDEHAEEHPHVNYGDPVPLVNSPRMGMCGYCGPADPPY